MTATAVDEYTIDVVTAAPDPILPSRLYFSPFVSMKLLKETPDQYPIKPVGTGPYRFVEWVRGQHVKLEVNPDWWGHRAADAYGKATIKDVTFIPRGEQEVRAAMVTTGEADFARWLVGERCQEHAAVRHRSGGRNHLRPPGHQPSVAVRHPGARSDRPGDRQEVDHRDADRRRHAGQPVGRPERPRLQPGR